MKVYTDAFLNAVAKHLATTEDLDIAEVYSFEERVMSSGGCETCAFDWVVVDVTYKDSQGRKREFRFDDDFATLVRALTD
ncbi:hypothetical protein ACFXG4_23435 [Nocardia sp. NPDC059246]|uniref:hypothetical protein n=1 Tax=unclassified Nocardia TaxID=2637762 RepID=UPI0036A91CF3